MKKLITSLCLAFVGMHSMAQAPTVTTDTRFARGSTMAFGRATFTANGSAIIERGFCWSSETKEPTIADNITKSGLSNNGMIYWMKNLTPATKYYARAYAKAEDGSVGYGKAIKIVTLPKGTIQWNYDDGADAAANSRIRHAVSSCVDYWNNLTSINNLTLSVHFGSGTPTADCSYGGWMRVGPSPSYQRTGTIMHEALHAIGVGTTGVWNAANTPLRANSGRGQWLGDRATEVLRFWDNNNTSTLNGDYTHLWPYGINGAHEDNGSEVLYIGTSLVAQAVCEDGLPPSWANAYGLPYYSFDQEDDVKYYIKNESDDYGLYSSFLVEDANHNLKWQAMTAAEAAKNDAAAWYVTFTPGNQYYQLRNAATGYYMTYSTSGVNGIKTAQRSKLTSAENFHLMRSRIDVTTNAGSLITPQRGYWVIHPENTSASPGCLAAYSNGNTTVQSLNLADNRQVQRWLILTNAQAEAMEDNSSIAAREVFANNKKIVEALAENPHIELTPGATATLTSTIAELTAKCNASTVLAEIQQYSADVLAAGKTFLEQVMVSDLNKPFDLTNFLVNADFSDGVTGWTVAAGATHNLGEIEFFQSLVNVSQTVRDMPKGSYAMRIQAFQRPGATADVYKAYAAGDSAITVSMWMNQISYGRKFIKNIMADRQKPSCHGTDKRVGDGTYVPDNMQGAAIYFARGYYDNELISFMPNRGDMSFYLRGKNTNASSWTCIDNARLYYYGPMTMDEITSVPSVVEHEKNVTSTAVYSISGQYVGNDLKALPAGIYIQNHKKIKID